MSCLPTNHSSELLSLKPSSKECFDVEEQDCFINKCFGYFDKPFLIHLSDWDANIREQIISSINI